MKYLIKVLAITAALVSTFAQEKPPEAKPAADDQRPLLRQRFDRTPLDLTAEQKTKMEEINRAYSTNATPLFARLSTARRELEGLVNQATLNEAGIRAKGKEIGDLEAELAVARAKRYTAFLAFLTPEQARRINTGAPIARPFQPSLHEGQTPPPVSPNK